MTVRARYGQSVGRRHCSGVFGPHPSTVAFSERVVQLPGTDGALNPFWSPDSRVIAFFAGGKLKKIEVAGGPAQTLCDTRANPRGGSWSQGDVIVFASSSFGALFRVPAAGGSATPLTELDQTVPENSHRFPWFLPDGRHFLYTARSGGDPEKDVVYVGDLDSKTRQRVAAVSSNAVYVPGYLLFLREQTLMAQPFDAAKARTTGDAVAVAQQVGYIFANRQGEFSASQNGVLAYTSGASGATYQLTWMDRSGRALGTLGAPGGLSRPAISPDGKTVAVDRRDPGTGFDGGPFRLPGLRPRSSLRYRRHAITSSSEAPRAASMMSTTLRSLG